MHTFKQHLSEYDMFVDAITLYQNDSLNEGIFPSFITDKIEFIKDLASQLKTDVKELMNLFKNKVVFTFFNKIKWSMTSLFTLIQRGYNNYKKLLDVISEYVASTGVVKWTAEALKELDRWLEKHPLIKKIGGIGVGAILIYIWFNMTFTGDAKYDFDMSDIIDALSGNYSLSQLFASESGVKMLMLFISGSFITFPWPGHISIQFIAGVVATIAKKTGIHLHLAYK